MCRQQMTFMLTRRRTAPHVTVRTAGSPPHSITPGFSHWSDRTRRRVRPAMPMAISVPTPASPVMSTSLAGFVLSTLRKAFVTSRTAWNAIGMESPTAKEKEATTTSAGDNFVSGHPRRATRGSGQCQLACTGGDGSSYSERLPRSACQSLMLRAG